MVSLCAREKCTGCFACYNACSFDAISVQEDDTGVLRPVIDPDKCRECRRCESVCPILHEKVRNPVADSAIACYTKHADDRVCSSSGGAAAGIYRYALSEGALVFGAGFSEDGTPVLKSAETQEQTEEFKGSKYVYAFPGKIYRDVKQALDSGRNCVFIGMPCQVDGLKSFLGKEYPGLLTVDIICHGTPPEAYLRQHTAKYISGKPSYAFRGKKDYYLTVFSDGNEVFARPADEDDYYAAFSSGLIQRGVCFSCPYAESTRVGDLTIGDFWGLGADALQGYRGRVSLVLPNTEKGKQYWQSVAQGFTQQLRPVSEAIDGNNQLRRPSLMHGDRNVFLEAFRTYGTFDDAIRHTSLYREVRFNRVKNKILKYPRKLRNKLQSR